jgi:hypothetical protein
MTAGWPSGWSRTAGRGVDGRVRRTVPVGAKTVTDLIPGFQPENDLERVVSRDPVLIEGLAWGKPRRGHPEGSVAEHVGALLETIDRWGETGSRRADLRFVAIVHDALKYRVSNWRPKTGDNHHAVRARRFAERYTDDERLLATIELHDRPYNVWRRWPRRSGERRRESDDRKVDRIIQPVPDLDLFVRFLELDGSTEGKDPEPIRWFKGELARRGLTAGGPERSGSG